MKAKKLFALLLSLVMVVGLLPTMALAASAAEPVAIATITKSSGNVTYYDGTGTNSETAVYVSGEGAALQAAVSAATAGETVTMLKDVNLDNGLGLNIPEAITLDGGEKTLTTSGTFNYNDAYNRSIAILVGSKPKATPSSVANGTALATKIDGTVTIQNLNLKSGNSISGNYNHGIYVYASGIALDNVTINGSDDITNATNGIRYGLSLNSATGTATIKDSTMSGWANVHFRESGTGWTVNVTGSTLKSAGVFAGASNTFGAFASQVSGDNAVNLNMGTVVTLKGYDSDALQALSYVISGATGTLTVNVNDGAKVEVDNTGAALALSAGEKGDGDNTKASVNVTGGEVTGKISGTGDTKVTLSGGTFTVKPGENHAIATGKAVVPNFKDGEIVSYSVVDKSEAEYTIAWKYNGAERDPMTGNDEKPATTTSTMVVGSSVEITSITGGQKTGKFQQLKKLATEDDKVNPVKLAAAVYVGNATEPLVFDYGELTLSDAGNHTLKPASKALELGWQGTVFIVPYTENKTLPTAEELGDLTTLGTEPEATPQQATYQGVILAKLTIAQNQDEYRINAINLVANADGTITGTVGYADSSATPLVGPSVSAKVESSALKITLTARDGAKYAFTNAVAVELAVNEGATATLTGAASVTYQIDSEDAVPATNVTLKVAADAKMLTLPNGKTTIGESALLTGAADLKPNTSSGFDFTLNSDVTVNQSLSLEAEDTLTLGSYKLVGKDKNVTIYIKSARKDLGSNFYYSNTGAAYTESVPAGYYTWDETLKGWVQEGYAASVTITGAADVSKMSVSATLAGQDAIPFAYQAADDVEGITAGFTAKLPAGEYTLTVTNPPAGYRVPTQIGKLTVTKGGENTVTVALEAFAVVAGKAAMGDSKVTTPSADYNAAASAAGADGAIPVAISATNLRKWTVNSEEGYWSGFSVYPTVGVAGSDAAYIAPLGVKYEEFKGASTSFTSNAKTAAPMTKVNGTDNYNGYAFYKSFDTAEGLKNESAYYLVQFFADANCTEALGVPTLYKATWNVTPATATVTLTAEVLDSKVATITVDGKEYKQPVVVLLDDGTLAFNVKTPDAKNYEIKSVAVTTPTTGGPTLAPAAAQADKLDQDYTLSNITGDATVTVTLEAIIPTVTAIKIAGDSAHETEYPEGTTQLDLTGLKLNLTMSNGTTDTWTYDATTASNNRYVKAEIDATNNTRVNVSYLDSDESTVLASTYYTISYYKEYTITIDPAVQGVTLEVAEDLTKSAAEETITFTAEKGSGQTGNVVVTVTDAESNPVVVTAIEDGYTFTMPAANVTISATLEEDEPEVVSATAAIIKDGEEIVPSFKVDSSADKDTLLEGLVLTLKYDKGADSTVTYTASGSGSNADKFAIKADKAVINSNQVAGDGEVTVIYQIAVGNSVEAKINITTYTETEVTFAFTLDGAATEEKLGSVKVWNNETGAIGEKDATKATVKSTEDLIFQVEPEAGYIVVSDNPITPTAQKSTNGWSIAGSTFSEEENTVTINVTQKEYNISNVRGNDANADYTSGTVTFKVAGATANKAKPGASVEVTIAPISGMIVKDVTFSDNVTSYAKAEDTSYSFVMPAGDATVTVVYVKAPSTDTSLSTVLNKSVTAVAGTDATAPGAQTIKVAGNFSGEIAATDVVAAEKTTVALYSDAAFTTNVTTKGWTYTDEAPILYVLVTAEDTSVKGYYAITIEKDATTTSSDSTAKTDDATGNVTAEGTVDGSDANVEAVKEALKETDALNIDATTGSSSEKGTTTSTVAVPESIVDALIGESAEESKGANVETDAGTIELSGEAMDQIKDAISGDDASKGVSVALAADKAVADQTLADMNTSKNDIANATGGQKPAMIFSADVFTSGTGNTAKKAEIKNLEEPIKLTIPLGKGFANRNPVVWYIDTLFGTLEKMNFIYDKATGMMTGDTSHLSTFIVTVDEGDYYVEDIGEETGTTIKTRMITLGGEEDELKNLKVVIWITQGEGADSTQYMLTINGSKEIEVSYKDTAKEVQVQIVSARPDFNDAEHGFDGIKLYHEASTN